jgi:uncharacterized protein YjbI with pentapeptide repeats
MEVKGYRKWKRIAGPALLSFVLLLSSWSIVGWFGHTLAKDQTFQSDEENAPGERLEKKLQQAKQRGGGDHFEFKENEDLSNEVLVGIDFKKAKLKKVKLKKAKLNGADLAGAILADADLRQADLEYANLEGAILTGTNLSGTNLGYANFAKANLLDAIFEGARLEGTNFKNSAFLTQDQLDEACGKPKALPEGLRAPKSC